jgi:integrase
MGRKARPWYSAEKRCYMAYIAGKKVRLLDGEKCAANQKRARSALTEQREFRKKTLPTALTVASLIDRYLTLHEAEYEERAFSERKRYLQLFAEDHGWRNVNDQECTPDQLKEWLLEHAKWKSDWTKAHVVSIVQRPFNWAVKNRLLAANPYRGFIQSDGDPRRPLVDEEFRALLRATGRRCKRTTKAYPCEQRRRQRPSSGARFRQVLIFLKFTGSRPGELCGLRWSNIDWNRAEITLRHHKTSRRTKKPRIIALHPVVVKLLHYLRRLHEPGECVFLTHRKTHWNRSNLSLRMRRTRAKAGIPDDAKLYGLRHRYGTAGILAGCDVKTMSELLGHSTTRMTEHYLHVSGRRAHLADATLRVNAQRLGD